MRRAVNKFDNSADARRANRHYYLSLTPQQRLDILLDLIAAYRDSQDEAARGFTRVYRITELGRHQSRDRR